MYGNDRGVRGRYGIKPWRDAVITNERVASHTTLTVTGTSSALSHSVPVNLTVNYEPNLSKGVLRYPLLRLLHTVARPKVAGSAKSHQEQGICR